MQRRVHVPVADVRPRPVDVAQPQPELRQAQPPVRVADVAKTAELQPAVRGDRQEAAVL